MTTAEGEVKAKRQALEEVPEQKQAVELDLRLSTD